MADLVKMMLGPLLLIHLVYIFAVIKKDLSLIDSIWGLGFILISLIGCSLADWSNTTQNLIFLMVFAWGLRLSLFIYFRNHGKPEDFRYAQWRKDWGDKVNIIAYFKVYLLQWCLMGLVALPIFAVHFSDKQSISWQVYPGVLFWTVGLLWETVADYQKSAFKKNHPHSICTKGLWFYSRHPNYFGETLLWWGIGIVSLAGGQWWGPIGPLFLNFLLLKVSGVPLIEARHEKNPEYLKYKNSTPTLIPDLRRKA